MKTLILSIILCCLLQPEIKAQRDLTGDKEKKFTHAVGIGAGFCTGYGLAYLGSYQRFKAQMTFFPYYEKWYSDWDNTTYEDTDLKTGFTFYYILEQNRFMNFFLYQSNLWSYYQEKEKFTAGWRTQTTNFTRNGIGIGFEFRFLEKASFHLMGGYGWYGDENMVTVTGETGIFYNFR